MKTLFFSLLSVAFFTVFAQPKINKGETLYRIYTNKSLQIINDSENFSAQIDTGKDLVFEYYMRADERADMSDDEYTEKILFSAPKNVKSFNYTGKTLNAVFLRGCFCMDRGWHPISDGFIKGKKINSTTWIVEMDIMTKADPSRNANAITKKIKATFKIYAASPAKKKK
jgi:hypothetical protein